MTSSYERYLHRINNIGVGDLSTSQRKAAETTEETHTLPHNFLHYPSHWQPLYHHIANPYRWFFAPTYVTWYDPETEQHHVWTSRANRKHIHYKESKLAEQEEAEQRPLYTYFIAYHPSMFAWWNAVSFTLGSVGFVIESTAFLFPSIALENKELSLCIGIMALASAVLFAAGGLSQVLEALQGPITINRAATHCKDTQQCNHVDREGKPLKDRTIPDYYSQPKRGEKGYKHSEHNHTPTHDNQHQQHNINDNDTRIDIHNPNQKVNGNETDTDTHQDAEADADTVDGVTARNTGGDTSSSNTPKKDILKSRHSYEEHHDVRNSFHVLRDSKVPLIHRLYVVFFQFHRADYMLAMVQFIGTLLFVVNSVGQAGWYKKGEEPGLDDAFFYGVTVGPDITASCTFVIAGYLQFVEAVHRKNPVTLRHWRNDVYNVGFWASWCNTMGGAGFLANAVLYALVPWCGGCEEYVMNVIPLLIGSWFFLLGSVFDLIF